MKLLLNTLSQFETQSLAKRNGQKKTRAKLMTHVVLGYPNLKLSMDIVCAMANSGASIIELQIPFSDPMADGPTIMRANEAALAQGLTPAKCMKAMDQLSSKCSVPLLFMSYFNLLFTYRASKKSGVKRFCLDARNAGAQGLIVPDIPPEESDDCYFELARANKLIPVPLVSPLSSDLRLKKIAKVSPEGFVYCVSTTGTTGARTSLPSGLKSYVKNVRRHFSLPLALGFGISSPQQISALSPHVEIAIVGSAMIDKIDNSPKKSIVRNIEKFTKLLAKG